VQTVGEWVCGRLETFDVPDRTTVQNRTDAVFSVAHGNHEGVDLLAAHTRINGADWLAPGVGLDGKTGAK